MGGGERPLGEWSSGRLRGARSGEPILLFGRMHEDWTLEAELFAPGGRVLCVASAGCTAFALARRGHDVVAVDVNPAQVAYVRERLAGAAPRPGAVERRLAALRRLGPLVGWSPSARREFAALDDVEAQRRYWRELLDTRRLRAALAVALDRRTLRLAYAQPLVAMLPPRFDRVFRGRLARCFARHANRANPYARALLLGKAEQPEPAPVELALADVADYLEAAPASSFDAFALSNVLDGAPPAYARRLWAAVRRAAAPGAVAVVRSFGEPSTRAEDELAARDRSLLWGAIRVERF